MVGFLSELGHVMQGVQSAAVGVLSVRCRSMNQARRFTEGLSEAAVDPVAVASVSLSCSGAVL